MGGETEGLIFVIFVVWSALIVGRWVVVVWTRKSYLLLAVFLVLFKDGQPRVDPRSHLLGDEVSLSFPCMTLGIEIFSLDIPHKQLKSKECAL